MSIYQENLQLQQELQNWQDQCYIKLHLYQVILFHPNLKKNSKSYSLLNYVYLPGDHAAAAGAAELAGSVLYKTSPLSGNSISSKFEKNSKSYSLLNYVYLPGDHAAAAGAAELAGSGLYKTSPLSGNSILSKFEKRILNLTVDLKGN
eukprot:TCONS_00019149-protein